MKIHIALKTLLACSLMLLVAGCVTNQVASSSTSPTPIKYLTPIKFLCIQALGARGITLGWDTSTANYRIYVTEAKRRGYTPQSCAKALGRTTQVASSSKATDNKLASMSQAYLCRLAITAVGWEAAWWAQEYVTEAKRRGYTSESCAKALGRTTRVASSSQSSGNKLASGDQKKLCTHALHNKWETWDTGLGYNVHVFEAKRRGYTPESCAKVLGRTTQAAKKLCNYALRSGNTQWEGDSRYYDYVTEAKRQGYTPESCAQALGRTTQVVSSSKATGNKLASMSQGNLCRLALEAGGVEWNTRKFINHVTEAKRRGYTPEFCAKARSFGFVSPTIQVASTPKPKTKAPELTTLDEAYVALNSANVRKGPGTAFEKVASLRKGDAITALGKVKDRDWYLIEKAGKKLGYVYGNLIAPEASQQVATPKPTPQPTKVAATKASTPRLASTSDIHFGKYHALVIGNNDYLHLPDLKTAMADAKAVKEVLVNAYGFDTKLLLNATRDDLLEALHEYRDRLQYDDNLLIYYAGHGVLDEAEDRGYWLPVDANEEVTSRWVANDDVTAKLKSIAAKHILVVADSCYSGTLTRSVSMKSQPQAERTALIRQYVKQKVRVALTSGGLEPVVDSGGSGHSVFAEAFLDALKANTDVLLGHELYTKIRGPVLLNAPQSPRYDNIRFSGHKAGDFLFVSKRTLKASVEEPTQVDVVFWQSVKDSSNADMVREYLKQFPDGMFAGLARIRIKELEAAR